MSLYFYAPKPYPGTKELIEMLEAKRLNKHDGMNFVHKGVPMEFSQSDAIVCWGAHVPPPHNVPCLNSSYKYTDMLSVNRQGFAAARQAGYTAFPATFMQLLTYRNLLEEVQGKAFNWPDAKYRHKFVPLPEFEGYGVSYYKFSTTSKVVVFGDSIILGKADNPITQGAPGLVKAMDLTFAELYIGSAAGTPVLFKAITAPSLDADGVNQFSKYITKWYKQVLENKKISLELKELLE